MKIILRRKRKRTLKILSKYKNYRTIRKFIKIRIDGKTLSVAAVETELDQFHVRLNGSKLYQKTFDYVGDFDSKTEEAFVKKDGKEFKIDLDGEKAIQSLN